MTLFTSDEKKADTRKMADACMIAALFTAVFGMIYEFFSFGVFSFAMIYAFGVFAAGGGLFWRLIGRKHRMAAAFPACLWNAGLCTFTVGLLLKGVLDIYGSGNSLIRIFWILGAAELLTALFTLCISGKKQSAVGKVPVIDRGSAGGYSIDI